MFKLIVSINDAWLLTAVSLLDFLCKVYQSLPKSIVQVHIYSQLLIKGHPSVTENGSLISRVALYSDGTSWGVRVTHWLLYVNYFSHSSNSFFYLLQSYSTYN